MWLNRVLITAVSLVLSGPTNVNSICVDQAVVGEPYKLTCEINGGTESALSWYKSEEPDFIVLCNSVGICYTPKPELYSITNVTNNVQKLTILNVTEDDLTETWTCYGGITRDFPELSDCTLTLKTVETTADCDRGGLNVGKPFTISCDIKGTVVKGIHWFRDGENFVVCNKTDGKCNTNDPGSYMIENVSNNRYQFTIIDVTEDDLRKTWTCVDSSTTVGTQGCSLIRLIEEAIGASVGSSFTVAVVLVIIDVIIYFVFKDNLSKVKKIYIIYCVVDVLVVGIVCGVSIYYIYLRTSDIGIIAGTCISFLVVSTVIKIIVVKTELFSKCS